MKKLFYTLAVATFMLASTTNTAFACEGGKCKMEHTDKNDKSKKSKKGAKAESCHSTAAKESNKTGKADAKACCMKKDTPKPAETKTN